MPRPAAPRAGAASRRRAYDGQANAWNGDDATGAARSAAVRHAGARVRRGRHGRRAPGRPTPGAAPTGIRPNRPLAAATRPADRSARRGPLGQRRRRRRVRPAAARPAAAISPFAWLNRRGRDERASAERPALRQHGAAGNPAGFPSGPKLRGPRLPSASTTPRIRTSRSTPLATQLPATSAAGATSPEIDTSMLRQPASQAVGRDRIGRRRPPRRGGPRVSSSPRASVPRGPAPPIHGLASRTHGDSGHRTRLGLRPAAPPINRPAPKPPTAAADGRPPRPCSRGCCSPVRPPATCTCSGATRTCGTSTGRWSARRRGPSAADCRRRENVP